jgi:hypothetical protein
MRQLNALLKRFKQEAEVWSARFGTVAAASANFSMCKDHNKPMLDASDFFSNLKKPTNEIELSPEQTLRYLSAVLNPKTAN